MTWLIGVPAQKIRPLAFILIVGPSDLPDVKVKYWMTGSWLKPPLKTWDYMTPWGNDDFKMEAGSSYLPVVTFPGSFESIASKIQIGEEECAVEGPALHDPIVFQPSLTHWFALPQYNSLAVLFSSST